MYVIRIVKDCKISFSLYEPICEFKKGQICELAMKRAKRLIEKEFAEKADPKPLVEESKVEEPKDEDPEVEEKAADLSEKENKMMDVSAQENKADEKPKRGRKSKK